MDSIKIILLSGVVFNLWLVFMIIYFVKRSRTRQKDQALVKRQQMLEQGKIIVAQESLLKSKQKLLKEKEALLNEYRKITE